MPRHRKKKTKDIGEDFLRQIGSTDQIDKRRIPDEIEKLAQDIGRSYTETGKLPGTSMADDLMALIGASAADEIDDVGHAEDASSVAAKVQADAQRKQKEAYRK